jgi:F-type H+-transporting ATPase subunit a
VIAETANAAETAGELTPGDIFSGLFGHLMPTEYTRIAGVPITNHTILIILAGVIILALYIGLAKKIKGGQVGRGPLANMLEALVVFMRDELIYDTMGKETGRKFAPLFLTQFFFIWVSNLLGLLPLWPISGTATASLNCAAALATTTFIFMMVCSLKVSGPIGMWKALVPHGVPGWMWPLMFVVEVAGFFIKPIALVIRLFANMTGGHLVLLSMFGLIYVFQSVVVAGMVYPMVIFVALLELLVAFLQAFIFTFLSIMFVQSCVHPEH